MVSSCPLRLARISPSLYVASMSAAVVALPYVAVFRVGGLPTYVLLLMLALALGAMTSVLVSRRFGVPRDQIAIVVAWGLGAAVVGGHVFDVIAYQWHDASENPFVWWQVSSGTSLFGALLGIAIATIVVCKQRGFDLRRCADTVAIGCVVAMTIGRIGCALVHDHPGIATSSFVGIDVPTQAYWGGLQLPVRAHDVGLDELLVMIPIAVVAFILMRRRFRPGMTAAILAIVYGSARFALDFLRLEPRHGGLTSGQWASIAMFAIAAFAFTRVRASGA